MENNILYEFGFKYKKVLYPYKSRKNANRPYKDAEDVMLDTLDYLEV